MCQPTRLRHAAFVFLAAVTGSTLANPCGDILRQGVYDTLNEEMGAVQASQFSAMLCMDDSTETERAFSGRAGAKYGAFSGSASASKSSRDAYRKAMCSEKASDEDLRSFSRFVRSSASPVIVEAWAKCTEMNKKGVVAELTQDIGTVSIGAYVAGATAKVVRFDITPSSMRDKVTCTGVLSRATEESPVELDKTSQYLSCSGPVEADPSGRPTYAPEFTVNLKTTQGELQYFSRTFLRDITSEEAKELRNEIRKVEERATTPTDAVLAFDSDACPDGWEQVQSLAGRTVIGAGPESEGTSIRVRGDKGGEEMHAITIDEMPAHNHGNGWLGGGSITPAQVQAAGRFPSNLPTAKGSQISSVGGSKPHNNMPPFLVLTYCKKL